MTTHLVIDHDLLVILVVALHAQVFAITAHRVSSTLAFDALCACLLCPMNTALPQSITEKSTAWILRLPRNLTARKQADGKTRFTIRCCRHRSCRVFRTRTVRARDATGGRVGRGGGLVLRQTARLEFRGGRSGWGWRKMWFGERRGCVWAVRGRRGGCAGTLEHWIEVFARQDVSASAISFV